MSDTIAFSLEKLVRDEINSWNITDNQDGSSSQNIKDLLYGIGLRVTEEVLDELKECVAFSNFEPYLDKHLNPSFEEFKKHYLSKHYINSGFNTRKAANATGYSENHGAQSFHGTARNAGISLKKVKKNPETYRPHSPKLIIDINHEEILENVVNMISGYLPLLRKSQLGDFLDDEKNIAETTKRLTANAKKILASSAEEIAKGEASVYRELPIHDYLKQKYDEAQAYFKDECLDPKHKSAYKNFRENYLIEQFFRSEPADISPPLKTVFNNIEDFIGALRRETGVSGIKLMSNPELMKQVIGMSMYDDQQKSLKLLNLKKIKDHFLKKYSPT